MNTSHCFLPRSSAATRRRVFDSLGASLGSVVGPKNLLSLRAVEGISHIRDLHVTLMRLPGLDDLQFTCLPGGRCKQPSLSDGRVFKEFIS